MANANRNQENGPPSSEDTSRILIHAGATSDDIGKHPEWRGNNDRALDECDFAVAEKGLDAKETMSDINSRIEHVLDKAPSDSTANLLLKKSKDGYRAFFKVRSAQGKFVGFIRGRNLIETVDRVVNQVRKQIDDWKENRQLADETA